MSFRDDVRSFLATAERPEDLVDYGPTPNAHDVPAGRAWQATLAAHGLACLHWPVEHGGRNASVTEQAVFAEECALAGVPRQLAIVGPDLAGPTLIRFGSPEQCAQLLDPIRTGADLWCQLFSEPDAGSDLAAVRTRATPRGDGWVVDGQKVWTSGAARADWGLLLARTGPDGSRGLSMFVVPMDAPGIVVRPLRQMDDESKFNEVFLTGVELDASALIGSVGEGWKIATATLGRERLSLGANAVGMFSALDDIVQAALERGRLDEHLTDRLTQLWIRVWLLRATWERAVEEGDDLTSAAFSVLKLMTSETYRDLGLVATEAIGASALERDHPLVKLMLVGHAQTILGGTSEIQRNILAERVLGLPRPPR